MLNNGFRSSNERLEYLGDAVLGSIVADYLFKKYPFREEGFLTEMRSKIVSRENIGRLSKKVGLSEYILSNGGVSKSKSIEGDAFEAVIGAIYLDKGYNFTRKVVINKIIQQLLNIDELEKERKNFKSQLLEFVQKEKKELEFRVIDKIGKANNLQYKVEVYIDEKAYGIGQDFTIKKAEQNAAEKALNKVFPDYNN